MDRETERYLGTTLGRIDRHGETDRQGSYRLKLLDIGLELDTRNVEQTKDVRMYT